MSMSCGWIADSRALALSGADCWMITAESVALLCRATAPLPTVVQPSGTTVSMPKASSVCGTRMTTSGVASAVASCPQAGSAAPISATSITSAANFPNNFMFPPVFNRRYPAA
ncbi:MAG: hypothetical protein U0521_06690 [Anaerolineae bacterium]